MTIHEDFVLCLFQICGLEMDTELSRTFILNNRRGWNAFNAFNAFGGHCEARWGGARQPSTGSCGGARQRPYIRPIHQDCHARPGGPGSSPTLRPSCARRMRNTGSLVAMPVLDQCGLPCVFSSEWLVQRTDSLRHDVWMARSSIISSAFPRP